VNLIGATKTKRVLQVKDSTLYATSLAEPPGSADCVRRPTASLRDPRKLDRRHQFGAPGPTDAPATRGFTALLFFVDNIILKSLFNCLRKNGGGWI
jgi:hypothetical protein